MGMFHRMRINENEIVVLSDGATAFPSDFLMVGVDRQEQLEACDRWGLDPEAVSSSLNCIYINLHGRAILFDTGAGATMPGCGKLLESLEAAGIDPASVEQVVHTHLHLDHIGSNTDANGSATFPNADYCVGETEFAFWSDERNLDAMNRAELWNLPDFEPAMAASVRAQVLALGDRVKTFPDDGEPAPGVRAIPAFGHTPGHLAFEVDLGDVTLFVMGDLVLSPFHFDRGDWYPAVDLDPRAATASRARVLDVAAKSNGLVDGYHLPFPGIGEVTTSGEGGWNWVPVPRK